jgi:hypothetical protein
MESGKVIWQSVEFNTQSQLQAPIDFQSETRRRKPFYRSGVWR